MNNRLPNNFVEPIPIKAGYEELLLGPRKEPPVQDCRVISEGNYQLLLDHREELLEGLKDLVEQIGHEKCSEFMDQPLDHAERIIKKVTI